MPALKPGWRRTPVRRIQQNHHEFALGMRAAADEEGQNCSSWRVMDHPTLGDWVMPAVAIEVMGEAGAALR